MRAEWQRFCTAEGLIARDGGIDVQFENGRSQKEEVEDRGEVFLLQRSCSSNCLTRKLLARDRLSPMFPNENHRERVELAVLKE
jgi:hypothetical protein